MPSKPINKIKRVKPTKNNIETKQYNSKNHSSIFNKTQIVTEQNQKLSWLLGLWI